MPQAERPGRQEQPVYQGPIDTSKAKQVAAGSHAKMAPELSAMMPRNAKLKTIGLKLTLI